MPSAGFDLKQDTRLGSDTWLCTDYAMAWLAIRKLPPCALAMRCPVLVFRILTQLSADELTLRLLALTECVVVQLAFRERGACFGV
eukprot:3629963-Rhodomonas_salina.1